MTRSHYIVILIKSKKGPGISLYRKKYCLYLKTCCNADFTEINCQVFDGEARFVYQIFYFTTVWSGFSILKKAMYRKQCFIISFVCLTNMFFFLISKIFLSIFIDAHKGGRNC